MAQAISDSYTAALKFASDHYENFPVVSFLIPGDLKKHVAVIYWFARTADDIADEGYLSSVERLKLLDDFSGRFNNTLQQNFAESIDEALFTSIKEKKLDPQHFRNLLNAFKQDVIKKRYASYTELLDYCQNSAVPVGRLLLSLFNIHDEAAYIYSDKICTALQITNFLQDVQIDYQKGRIYLPQEELAYFGVEESIFEMKENSSNFKELMKFNVDRTYKLFEQGKNLLPFLHGRFRLEIKWTIAGGEEILKKIRKIDYNVLGVRPTLSKKDFIYLLIKSSI